MPRDLTWLDRLRIESTIWAVNTKLVDLRASRRKSIRQELRANLRAAAAEVGARESVRQLGSLRRLAGEYLDAEYGDRPHPRYFLGLAWAVAVEVAYLAALLLWFEAYLAGVDAVKPHPDGTFTVGDGIWLPEVGVTYAHGKLDGWEFSLPLPMFFLLPTLAYLIGARSWRWLRFSR
jgi:hypothetical protein